MPEYRKGFIHIPILLVIAIVAVVVLVLLKSTSPSSNPLRQAVEKAKEKISLETKSDLIEGYPHECFKRMGFDNWRTFRSFAVDPGNSQTLYVAVEYKGVFKSTDGGKTWNTINKGLRGYPDKENPQVPCAEQHPYLLIDPTNTQRLLLTSAASPGMLTDMNSESGGLYESANGGESWHQLFRDNMNAWTYEALAIDLKNPEIVYVGTGAMPASRDDADPDKIFVTKGILYKSEDGGKNWTELATGIVPHLRSGQLFIEKADPSHLLLTTFALPPNRGGGNVLGEQVGILESKDAGVTWKALESLPKDSRAVSTADIAPANFNNMFISVRRSNEDEARYVSQDAGKTFTRVDTQVNLFRFDPHDATGSRLLGLNIHASPRSIFESLDGGKTWHAYGSYPKEANNESRISNIVWDPKDKNVVYLNGDEGKVWKSEDNAKTWQLILSLDKLGQ